MAVEKIKHSLELDESLDLHEMGWKAQRVLLIVFILFIIAAITGLFGNGPLSNVKAADNNNFIEYEKYSRYESHTQLKVRATAIEGITQVQFPQEYFNHFQIEKIVPEPKDTKVENGMLTFSFKSEGIIDIDFFSKNSKVGSVSSSIKVNNSTFNLSHFIYP